MAQPVAAGRGGRELPGLDPVVDGAGAEAEPVGGVGDADLAVGEGAGGGILVGVAHPLHGLGVERCARAGAVPGGVERGRRVRRLLVVGPERGSTSTAAGAGRRLAVPGGAAGRRELVGGAGVPADPDPHLGAVGSRGAG